MTNLACNLIEASRRHPERVALRLDEIEVPVECAGHSANDGDRKFGWYACRIALLDQAGCVGPVDEVHRDPKLALLFPPIMDSDDVGMAEACSQVGFADEPFSERGVAGDVGPKNLQGILAGQAGMLDQVHLAHSARTQQPQNPVPGECFTDAQWHEAHVSCWRGRASPLLCATPSPDTNWPVLRPGQTAQPVSLASYGHCHGWRCPSAASCAPISRWWTPSPRRPVAGSSMLAVISTKASSLRTNSSPLPALLGFENVIDAFHVVGTGDVQTRFFHDERKQSLRGIRFTDELLILTSDANAKEPLEAEAESLRRAAAAPLALARLRGSAAPQAVRHLRVPRCLQRQSVTGRCSRRRLAARHQRRS
jgi:hypothetical protein